MAEARRSDDSILQILDELSRDSVSPDRSEQLELVVNRCPRLRWDVFGYRVLVWNYFASGLRSRVADTGRWFDELDYSHLGHHFLIKAGNKLVAASRLSLHEQSGVAIPERSNFSAEDLDGFNSFGALNRLVVHPDYRGSGLARLLLLVRIYICRRLGVDAMVGVACGDKLRDSMREVGFSASHVTYDCDTVDNSTGPFYGMVLANESLSCDDLKAEIQCIMAQESIQIQRMRPGA